jgi:hypothetical protein
MTEPRQIATARDYAQLHAALRARAKELALSRETIDAISGLQSGYTGKLLAPVPIKGLGPASLGPILGALGVFIVLVEDVEMLERYAARQPKKSETFGRRTGQDVLANKRRRGWALLPLVTNPEFQKVMRCRQLATQGAEQRKRIARKAARARWKRRRAT